MLALGDAHADDPANRQALLRAYDAAEESCALQAGDLMYYDLPYRTYFVAGNNEDFDVIDALRHGDGSLTGDDRPHLLASTAVECEGLRVAGLSGNYAPTRYGKSRDELRGDRRRHFTHEDVEQARSLTDVDVFLAHEAPHGLISDTEYEVGNRYVDTIVEELSPALCLIGHHHRHAESAIEGTRVISLAPVWDSYYRLDPATLSLERYETPAASA
jgi:Icc-related predicted phosphoesterase